MLKIQQKMKKWILKTRQNIPLTREALIPRKILVTLSRASRVAPAPGSPRVGSPLGARAPAQDSTPPASARAPPASARAPLPPRRPTRPLSRRHMLPRCLSPLCCLLHRILLVDLLWLARVRPTLLLRQMLKIIPLLCFLQLYILLLLPLVFAPGFRKVYAIPKNILY
jgi:hypothetical protein